jgi:hypothetical protein
VAVSHTLPEILILSKLTQIPDVSSRRRACKMKKSQRSEILTSSLYETAVKDSVQQKFITGTEGGGGMQKNKLYWPTYKKAERIDPRHEETATPSKTKRTVLARHIWQVNAKQVPHIQRVATVSWKEG